MNRKTVNTLAAFAIALLLAPPMLSGGAQEQPARAVAQYRAGNIPVPSTC